MAFLEQFKTLMIPFEDIKSATNNFGASNLIGSGGFGHVYNGEMSRFKGQGLVAFKRLDNISEQGETEFSKEITTLSHYNHENLISLLGFCNDGREKILVYEYASNGSLDSHLASDTLTWKRRLKICFQAASALEYLHDPTGTNQRVIHCDIKSANILLDDKWNAKLSDLGLSKKGPANLAQSFLISNAVGTLGYCDPLFLDNGFLTKESDVYSFGVLLFEVLCGRLCYEITNGKIHILVPTWKEIYEQKRLEEIVFQKLMAQGMDHHARVVFSDIAYRCLKRSHEERPTMTEVVIELEIALESQEISEGKEELIDYEEIARTAEPSLDYRCKAEIKILLFKGVFLNSGKTWFSINRKGEHCEMISIAACLQTESKRDEWTSSRNSKFAVGMYKTEYGEFIAHVRPQFLTPSITYAVNLVFQFDSGRRDRSIKNTRLEYKLKGETKTSSAYHAVEREDGRWMLELYQFDTDQSMVDLEIMFLKWRHGYKLMEVEGIEFHPLEIVEHKVPKDGKSLVSENGKRDVQSIQDFDANWEEKLPTDYEDIIKWSKDSFQWTTKKELYSIFRNGFLVNGGQEWFSLDKYGNKCLMLSALSVIVEVDQFIRLSLPETRFGEGFQCFIMGFDIRSEIKSQALSSETTYASYLVYKLPEDQSTFKDPLVATDVKLIFTKHERSWYVHLVSPQTPIIKPRAGQNTHNPLNRPPQRKDLPQQRSDGWMEAKIWELETDSTAEVISMNLRLNDSNYEMISGLIVQGIELRPMHIDSSF